MTPSDITGKDDIANHDAIAGGHISEFIESFPLKHYKKGETIINAGDTVQHMFCMERGFVRSFDISERGDTQVIWYGRPEDIFPLSLLFDEVYEAPYFYDAFTDCSLHIIPAKAFSDFVSNRNDALMRLSLYLTEDNIDTTRRLHALSEPKAHEKILRTIDFFARRFSHPSRKHEVEVAIPLTHQDIANFIGLTRETVSHELIKIREEGIIDYDKAGITVYKDKLATQLDG
ncbi:Crp/Fnr family transcriptional regulator [Pedobacter sp.]|nr:Crp/Fnr family transcriptional regulator [Candidatus Saccharibacteria bacterium]